MLGAIIGDIVGSKYEFDNIKTKDFPFVSRGCTFTDDTVMTVAVARAIQSLSDTASVRLIRGLLLPRYTAIMLLNILLTAELSFSSRALSRTPAAWQ